VPCCAVLWSLLQAEDKVWADLSVEMAEVALLVAEGIWDELLLDTADSVSGLEQQQEEWDRQRQKQQAAAAQQLSAGLLLRRDAVAATGLAVV